MILKFLPINKAVKNITKQEAKGAKVKYMKIIGIFSIKRPVSKGQTSAPMELETVIAAPTLLVTLMYSPIHSKPGKFHK